MMAQKFFEDLKARNVILESKPYAINIGCGDGVEYEDPVYPLYAAGFRGVAIDADAHDALGKHLGAFDVALRPGLAVSRENIVSILAGADCPLNPSFLKIDIDGIDAAILHVVLETGFRPAAIQAEINTEIPPPYAFSVCASEKHRAGAHHGFYGFSLSYGLDLLARYGYRFYELDFETPWTHDALWVHESVLARAGLSEADPLREFFRRAPQLYHIKTAPRQQIESWWTRTDRDVVRAEIWSAMMEGNHLQHGHTQAPFELYIAS